jgi:hypothetical protein
MALISTTEVKTFLSITTTTYDSIISALIPTVTERLRYICNDPFTVQPLVETVYNKFHIDTNEYLSKYNRDDDIFILRRVSAIFYASSGTVISKNNSFASAQFAAGHDIFVRDSYLNDGYYEVDSVSTSTLTITSSYTFTQEATGASIFFSVVKWPSGIKPLVANLIQYDYQERPKRTGLASQRLGPWSESYKQGADSFGYPEELIRPFAVYQVPRYL